MIIKDFFDFLLETFSNPWVLFGFVAQAVFFLRFVVQLIASEKNKKTVVPLSFWYLSIVGAIMILVYAIYRKDIVFILGQGLSLVIYLRNLFIFYKNPENHKAKKNLSFLNSIKSLEFIFIFFTTVFLITLFIFSNISLKNKDFKPPIFSSIDVLEVLWNEYKINYVEKESGRTLDKSRKFITTSEGQSYTMLRAVWMDDKETFDLAWKWTKDILLRDDWLFSWLFGQRSDGSYGVIKEQGGNNSASDGDTDIALALYLAHKRWGETVYLNESIAIIKSIWENEVVVINGKPYLVANNLEKFSVDPWVIINVSYFSPYAYKIFETIDSSNDWDLLVDTSYDLIQKSSKMSLDKEFSVWLPPNWIEINRFTGEIRPADDVSLDTNYGYDAIRTPWRIAMDWYWFKDERAIESIKNFWYLEKLWNENKKIPSIISHNGEIIDAKEKIEMYGASLPYFMLTDKKIADEIYNTKIINNYNRDEFSWNKDPGYYGTNWGWFGIAFYNERLPNYTEGLVKKE